MKQTKNRYLSNVAQNLFPYSWEEIPVGKTYRFDMNTLPYTPPSLNKFLKDMSKNCPINEYADPTNPELIKLIAQYENVEPSMITLTNSGDEAIDILAKAFLNAGDTFVITPPTYEMFAIQCSLNRGNSLEIPLKPETFDVDDRKLIAISKLANTKLMFLVNPNNPTGSMIPPTVLERVIQQSNCIVVVDEVYREFYGKSVVPLIKGYQNLVVLRSFSKFAGLAGARIGYLVADTSLTLAFNAIKLPMGVSYLSSKLAEFVLKNDKQWMNNQIQMIISQRSRLTAEIRALGLTVYASQANFILVQIGDSASTICSLLKKKGIVIRDRSNKPFLSGCVRITIRSPEENNILIAALKEIL